ncbi:hypothetical protein F511_33394 [Dorcoceras hygrometricum]|uniref:Uncharacterized protein n=1 Tax=Dorcoceras hygrometricum TaxID=472368 RepID=A0A2Z7CFM3_9LAMI|nr:hypothetical protein F511_33394 [Dorcoceras hygrometricum]
MVRLWSWAASKRVMGRSRGCLGSVLVSGRALWSKGVSGFFRGIFGKVGNLSLRGCQNS